MFSQMGIEQLERALEAYPPRWEYGDQRAAIAESFDKLVQIWVTDRLTPGEREALKPLAEFYRRRVDVALEKLERTSVTEGVLAVKFYSSSLVFKSASGTVAVDFSQGPIRNSGEPEVADERKTGFHLTPEQRDRLSRLVDVSLITHRHHDHADYSLTKRTIEAGKTVIGPAQLKEHWKDLAPGITVPEYGSVQSFGPVDILTTLGCQYSRNLTTSDGRRVGVSNAENPGADSETVVYLFKVGGIVFLQSGENQVPAGDWLRLAARRNFRPQVKMSLGMFQGRRSLEAALADLRPCFRLPLHEYEMTHENGGNRTGHLFQGGNREAFERKSCMPLFWGEAFHLTPDTR